MITLVATKTKVSWNRFQTVLTTQGGKVKAIFPNNLKQPRRGTKTIIINCWTYNLVWAK